MKAQGATIVDPATSRPRRGFETARSTCSSTSSRTASTPTSPRAAPRRDGEHARRSDRVQRTGSRAGDAATSDRRSVERAEAKGPLTDRQSICERATTCRRLARDEGSTRSWREHRLDALVAPTVGPAWPTDLVNGDHYTGGSSTPAAVAGYPSITVPAGFGSEPAGRDLVHRHGMERGAARRPRLTPTSRPAGIDARRGS